MSLYKEILAEMMASYSVLILAMYKRKKRQANE